VHPDFEEMRRVNAGEPVISDGRNIYNRSGCAGRLQPTTSIGRPAVRDKEFKR